MIKLLLSWDTLPDHEQEHFEFLIREFAPKLAALGIRPIEAWFTLYGRENDNPLITVEAIADDLEKLRQVLATEEWQSLKESLLQYVTNFQQKVVRGRPTLQI